MTEVPESVACRLTATHAQHDHDRQGRTVHCPGVPCDHERRCCAEHGTHTSPHVGCILR